MKSKNHLLKFIILLLSVCILSCGQEQSLFLENAGDWDAFGDAEWVFEGNELSGTVAGGNTGFVMTHDEFSNFNLELEFHPDSVINSGVFIRCSNKEINTTDCYEFNIWDGNPNQDYRTGAMVTKTSALARVETINKWNTYRVHAENGKLQVWVNDVLTTDTVDESLGSGYVGLQALGDGTIKFRNVKISPL